MNHYVHPQMSPSEPVLLGVAMAHPRYLGTVLSDIEPADLHSPQHRAILRAFYTINGRRQPIEAPLVVAELERQHGARPLAGEPWAFVVGACLGASVTVPQACQEHRRAVLEARLRREAFEYADAIADNATGPLVALEKLLADSMSAMGRTLARIAEHTPDAATLRSAERPRAA
ncbi:hypothetical protein LWF15_09535 [Kineosporia rhizophila]|uniref:DnaB-like helicase N-terminal domain-containing protein n=1 Tax=Kineosporia rhizophila TaxID=84633 RepID=UPI001E2F31E0|nr:DnaB-like helicase N-terminal domain-containing protein [Kineosporia rhizophila]MCE0535755.1 hypothetical protein [Kineosporia rhizophila]